MLSYTDILDYGGGLFNLLKQTEPGVKRSKETWFSKIANIFDRDAFRDEVWEELGRSQPENPSAGVTTFDFRDETEALTQKSGAVCFKVPPDWPREKRFGRSGRWLRVSREGGYSQPPQPPQIRSITVAYEWELPRIERITVAEARAAIASGMVSGGMIPKLEESIVVLDSGAVGSVHIVGKLGHGDLLRAIDAPGAVGTALLP